MLRVLGFLAAIPVTLILVVIASSLLSLDWDRSHSQSAEQLPEAGAIETGVVQIDARGMRFRARVANLGNGGEGVILLHGFPETSAMWSSLITEAADAGYQIVAPDQRGYSPGARPAKVADYAIGELVQDVFAIADQAGFEQFHLVGHDWGSAVGWAVVMADPQRVLSWSSLSIAHPLAFAQALESDPVQQSRSGYFALFTTPWLPEVLATTFGMSLLENIWSATSDAQRTEYLQVFAEPGALSAALNWYRAMDLASAAGPDDATVETPVLFIWGTNDPAVGEFAVDLQETYLDGPYERHDLTAGHWLIEEQPDIVIPLILRHLERNSSAPAEPVMVPVPTESTSAD